MGSDPGVPLQDQAHSLAGRHPPHSPPGLLRLCGQDPRVGQVSLSPRVPICPEQVMGREELWPGLHTEAQLLGQVRASSDPRSSLGSWGQRGAQSGRPELEEAADSPTADTAVSSGSGGPTEGGALTATTALALQPSRWVWTPAAMQMGSRRVRPGAGAGLARAGLTGRQEPREPCAGPGPQQRRGWLPVPSVPSRPGWGQL